jgi:hypothetical protein
VYIVNAIIPFDSRYQFTFIEKQDIVETNIKHPVSNYYLKLNDLSINLLISLKWIEWGYIFFTSLKHELQEQNPYDNMTQLINNPIQNLNNLTPTEEEMILLIDNQNIKSSEEFTKMLNEFYVKPLFDENTKIHLKLKVNLKDYLLISEILKPVFILI